MKLSDIVDDTELSVSGAENSVNEKRKNVVSLPSDMANISIEETQAGKIADRNRQAAKNGESLRVQTGGTRLRDIAEQRKAAAATGHTIGSSPVWTMGAKAEGMRNASDEGVPYGAYREDSSSPATQNTNNALITNNKGDVHLGGIVSPGSRIYGELPTEDSTFYISQKFEEVEPFPMIMPDGTTQKVNTSSLRKLEWQFLADQISAPDVRWAGYYKVYEPAHESWVGTAIRSAYNLVPEMLGRSGQAIATAINTASYLYDWAAYDKEYALEHYNYYQDLIVDTVNEFLDATKIYYSDASEQYVNKYALIVGQTLGSVAVASLGSRAAIAALSAGEGLSDVASVQQATRELGYSPLASLGVGALAGTVTGSLSMLPEFVFPNSTDSLIRSVQKGLLALSIRNPGAITKMAAAQGWKRTFLEAGTEAGQEFFADYASTGFDAEKFESRWDEKIAIILASLAMGGASIYHHISKNKSADAVRDFTLKMTDMINRVEPELRALAIESNGLVTGANLDEILSHMKDPDYALQMTNIIKEAIVGNFDKFTPEQKESLLEIVKGWKGDELLKDEFEKLEVRMDELLETSGLTPEQKTRFRTYIRGAAAWQLATLGIKPSQIELPAFVSNERPESANVKFYIVNDLTNGTLSLDRINKIYNEVKSPTTNHTVASIVDANIKEVVANEKNPEIAAFVQDMLAGARQQIIDAITADVRTGGFTSTDVGDIYVSTRKANAPMEKVVDLPKNSAIKNPTGAQKSSANMAKTMMGGNREGMDLSQSLGEMYATHEFTHWLQFNTGLHGVEEYMKALNEVVETIVPGLLKGIDTKASKAKGAAAEKLDLDKAEAYAYAIGLAGKKAANVLGSEGYVADAMTFINQMLNASSMATKLGPELRAIYDFMHAAMKENQSMIEALLAEIPYEQLRGAIRDFVETGDPKGMGLDAVRALHVALNSIVNDTTSDMLHQAFGTRKNAENFMKATNDYYLKNNYEARVKAADEIAEKRAEANEEAGLPEQITPQAAPLMSEAFDRITVDGIVVEKDAKEGKEAESDENERVVDSTESKGEPKEEEVADSAKAEEESKATLIAEEFERLKAEENKINDNVPDFEEKSVDKSEPEDAAQKKRTPRKRTQKDGKDYDVDRMTLKMMDDAELVNYIKYSAHWLRLEQNTPLGQDLWVSPEHYVGWWERTELVMPRRLHKIESYVTRSMEQARERGLTKDQKIRKELEDANIDKGLFAIVEIEPLFTSGITDALAEIPKDKRTKAEQSLYTALSRYELDSNIYTDYEVLPALDAIGMRIENAEALDAKLSMIVADPKSRAQGYINTLTRMINSHVTTLSEKKSDILAHESMIADGILEPDYAGTEDDRTRIQKQYNQSVALSEVLYQEARELESKTSGLSAKEKDSLVQERAELLAKASSLKAMVNDGLTPSDLDADGEILEWAQRIFDRYLSGKKSVSVVTGKGKRTKTVLREVDFTEDEFVKNANTVLDMAREMESEARVINRKINKAEAAFSLYDQYTALEKKALADRILERAERTKEKAERTAAEKTKGNRFSYYFTPKYDSDFSSRMIGVKTINSSYAFLRSGDATDAQKEVVRDILSQNATLSSYINPARTFGKRPLLDTPSPLEEMNISVDEAVNIIRGGGLRPFTIDKSIIAKTEKEINDFIGKSYNLGGDSAPKTRSRIYAKLVDFMLHEDFGMGDVATSNDAARQMQVLLAIHEAKHLANDLFANYIGREQSFDKHPSLHVIPDSTFRFMKSPRWKSQMLEQKNTHGYTATEMSSGLLLGDSIAFPYGTIFHKGVVAVAGRTPSGAMTYVIRKDLSDEDIKMVRDNLAEAKKLYAEAVKAKEILDEPSDLFNVERQKESAATFEQKFENARQAALKAGGIMKLDEKVMSAEELRRVPVFRKPIGPANYESSVAHFKDLNRLYDEALPILGRHNLAQVAVMSLRNKEQDIFDSINPLKKEIAEELGTLDSPTVGLFAVDLGVDIDDVPELDPGLFAIIGGTFEDDMATYERAMSLEQEYVDKGQWYDGKVERDAIMSAEFARRDEQMKPRLAEAAVKPNEHGVSFMDQLRALGKAVKEVKTPKWLYFLGSGSGTDRKGRLLFGKVWDEHFGLSKAYSSAQQYRESRVHAMDEAAVSEVFGGSRRAYDKWRAEIKAEKFDAKVNGVDVKISRGEIMSIYAMKLAVEKYSSMNNQLARLRKYENIDGLLSNLTAEDKAFVEIIALTTMNTMRGGVSTVPKDWVPAVEMSTYIKDGWAGRRKSKANNDRGLIDSETSLAAMDLYDSVVSTVSRYATHASGLMVQLDNLRQILAFAGVDKSQYREFDDADRKTYEEIMEQSVALREAIAKKIGNAQAKWFLQGIEYDLANDPLSDDIGTTPGMEWFAKLTRGASSAALSLNFRQAIQNFGNYHRFFGLSGSGAIKFYTSDWINSVAHIREAWNLAMENPEFKRRFEQAGLSEHMRRIADVNQSSFLSELQTKLFEKGKDGASNMVSALNSLSSIGTKWGLATNVLPDIVGIALGNYAVWNDVLAKNNGNVAAAQREIADFVNNRISSSNYMTQSLLKKRLNKMGLGALVMFQSDQLQSFGTMAEAWGTFMNTKDPEIRAKAKKDVVSFFVSMGRYVAIKAGWVGAVASTAMGRDLSDEEWDYIYDSTTYELVAQMGGWSQFNNMGVSPFIRSLLEGEKFGPSIVTTSAVGRAISGARKTAKGDMRGFLDLVSESLAMSGIAPAFPGLLRIMDGIFKLASDNEHERDVGIKQIVGSSETAAMQQLGLSKSQKTGEIRPKKKLKKDGE